MLESSSLSKGKAASRSTQRRNIAEAVAGVKLALTVANFGVVAIDSTVPVADSLTAILLAQLAAFGFFLYAAVFWHGLRKGWLSLRSYESLSPFLDVLFATALVYATDGYQSPFNLWFVIAVVASGFSGRRGLPYAATFAALLAHTVIASVPQEQPLAPSVFLVRTAYLFGFAAMVAVLGSSLARQSESLASIEAFGEEVSGLIRQDEIVNAFVEKVQSALGSPNVDLALQERLPVASKGARDGPWGLTGTVATGEYVLGTIHLSRDRRFSAQEEQLLRLLSDRFGTALRRAVVVETLLRASADAERLRLADELHDRHLQTLGAIDFHLESLIGDLEGVPNGIQEAKEIRSMVRSAAKEARRFLAPVSSRSHSGPRALECLLSERWEGPSECSIDPSAELTEGQWHVAEMLLKEGLNNARRHGNARRVRFRIERNGREVSAALEADGLSPTQPVRAGYGLSRLRAVARANGGEVFVEPLESGGSILYALFEGASPP